MGLLEPHNYTRRGPVRVHRQSYHRETLPDITCPELIAFATKLRMLGLYLLYYRTESDDGTPWLVSTAPYIGPDTLHSNFHGTPEGAYRGYLRITGVRP